MDPKYDDGNPAVIPYWSKNNFNVSKTTFEKTNLSVSNYSHINFNNISANNCSLPTIEENTSNTIYKTLFLILVPILIIPYFFILLYFFCKFKKRNTNSQTHINLDELSIEMEELCNVQF